MQHLIAERQGLFEKHQKYHTNVLFLGSRDFLWEIIARDRLWLVFTALSLKWLDLLDEPGFDLWSSLVPLFDMLSEKKLLKTSAFDDPQKLSSKFNQVLVWSS